MRPTNIQTYHTDFSVSARRLSAPVGGAAQVMWAPEVFDLVVRFLRTHKFREA